MFKDLYKNANDKIPTDDAYRRVMERVSQESPKTKYSYKKVAMLAACFVLTISMISVYENYTSKIEKEFEVIPKPTRVATTTPEQDVTPSAAPIVEPAMEVSENKEKADLSEPKKKTPASKSKQEATDEINVPVVAETIVPEETWDEVIEPKGIVIKSTDKKNSPQTTDQIPTLASTSEDNDTSTPVAHEDNTFVVSETKTPENVNQEPATEVAMPAMENVTEPEQKPASGGGSSYRRTKIVKNQGMPEESLTSVARFSVHGEAITNEEYSRYLGKDVEAAVNLPENFVKETASEQILSLDDDENFNDQWAYYYTSDESSLFINTTKKTENIENIIENADYSKSNISGYDAVIFEEDVQKTAYMVAEDIGYSVTGIAVSDETFENVLISLVK